MDRQQLQMMGENAAAGLLERKGLRVLARNWRCKLGELDLVAMEGTTIVFVEVKCRIRDELYDPGFAVDSRKRTRLRRVAEAFLSIEHPRYRDCRFDVVSVVAGSPVRVRHVVDAF